MLEAHNGAIAAPVTRSRGASHGHAHLWWGILIAVLGIAGIAAVVVLAVLGLTTSALIVAIFTAAFFSRCFC
jgi:hypothetical protein